MTRIRGSSRYDLCTFMVVSRCIILTMRSVSDNRCRDKRREENQLDATEWFIALIICSTCFGHLYAHHQELETMFVILLHMVCYALFAGGPWLGARQQNIVYTYNK